MTDPFTRFTLPDPGADRELRRAARASLRLLDVAPDEIALPLFAAVWRAAAGGVDFSLYLAGPTGAGKSELAALAQQHGGAGLDSRHLPANWSSTANATEALAFLAKDAVLVVDDFAPKGSAYDVQRKHQEADRLLRGQGNSAGRGRMRADTTLRPAKPPRGLILSTGEDMPHGQSLQARMLVLAMAPGDLNWRRLTKRQRDASQGLYATALSGFVRWVAGRYDDLHGRILPTLRPQLRAAATGAEQHRRTPNIVADLHVGVLMFGNFAVACGALTREERLALVRRCWLVLGQAAGAQVQVQTAGEPARRFLELLSAAVAAGKAHLGANTRRHPANPRAWGWRPQVEGYAPQGVQVGWVVGDDLYLEPDAAYGAAQGMAQPGGDTLAVGSQTLHRRLHEQGLLASTDESRNRLVVRRVLEGARRSVLHLHAGALVGR